MPDVAFGDGILYGLLGSAGCSHGVPGIPNGVFRVGGHGEWRLIDNLGAFHMAHPVVNAQPTDFEPDGTPYSMIAVDDELYVIEPNHGELDRVSTSGEIQRVVDISASQGHIVPTAIAFHDGAATSATCIELVQAAFEPKNFAWAPLKEVRQLRHAAKVPFDWAQRRRPIAADSAQIDPEPAQI